MGKSGTARPRVIKVKKADVPQSGEYCCTGCGKKETRTIFLVGRPHSGVVTVYAMMKCDCGAWGMYRDRVLETQIDENIEEEKRREERAD